jgi:hypothetical protein
MPAPLPLYFTIIRNNKMLATWQVSPVNLKMFIVMVLLDDDDGDDGDGDVVQRFVLSSLTAGDDHLE